MANLSNMYRGDTKQYRIIVSKGTPSVQGKLATALTAGAITAIAINDFETDVPATSGYVMIVNKGGSTETIAYTAWSKTSTTYTLTVDATITNNYGVTDVCDLDGGRIDITDATFTFTAKETQYDTVESISKAGVILNAEAGELRITLEPEDTDLTPRQYYYDVEMVGATGAVSTLVAGTFNILQDITN